MVIKKVARKSNPVKRRRRSASPRPLGELLAELGARIPRDAASRPPDDGAANHDHYVYGSAKQY